MTQTKKRCTHPEHRDKCYYDEEEIYCKYPNDKVPCIYKYFKDEREGGDESINVNKTEVR
jgi:hypothetical protein